MSVDRGLLDGDGNAHRRRRSIAGVSSAPDASAIASVASALGPMRFHFRVRHGGGGRVGLDRRFDQRLDLAIGGSRILGADGAASAPSVGAPSAGVTAAALPARRRAIPFP